MDSKDSVRPYLTRLVVRHFVAGVMITCGLLLTSCEDDSTDSEEAAAEQSTEQSQIIDKDDREIPYSQLVGTYRGKAGTTQVSTKLRIERYDGHFFYGWLEWPGDTRDVRCFFEDPFRTNMLWVQVFHDGSDWTRPDWVLSDFWHLHWRTDVLDGTGDKLQSVDGGYATKSTYSVYLTRVK